MTTIYPDALVGVTGGSGYRDPEQELIRPVLEDTRNVLNSVNLTESVKRVVLTSSGSTRPK